MLTRQDERNEAFVNEDDGDIKYMYDNPLGNLNSGR